MKMPQLQRDLPLALQKEGAQGLLPLPVPFHASAVVNPGQTAQQADVANDSKFREVMGRSQSTFFASF